MKTLLRDICYIRSGDKGDVCTAGLIAMTPEAYPTLLASVTPEGYVYHDPSKITRAFRKIFTHHPR